MSNSIYSNTIDFINEGMKTIDKNDNFNISVTFSVMTDGSIVESHG